MYVLIDKVNKTIVKTWNEDPDFIKVGNDEVHCPSINTDYNGQEIFQRFRYVGTSNDVVSLIRNYSDYEINNISSFEPSVTNFVFRKSDSANVGDVWNGTSFITPPIIITKEELKSQVSALFEQKWQEPIEYSVSGTSYTWDADNSAVQNISGVVVLILAGVPVPNPRTWTPYQSNTPIQITHAELIGLGLAIASRKDTLFFKKKTKYAEIDALTDTNTYDVNAGW